MLATVFPFLDTLISACAAFGPFFLVLGIYYRTSSMRETHPRVANAMLVGGGVMIAFCLLQTVPTAPVLPG